MSDPNSNAVTTPEIPPAPRPHKLRWYQYSLRTLLLFSVLFAVGVSIVKTWSDYRSHGKISLCGAADKGDLNEIEWLLDHGADVNAPDTPDGGDTAIIFAAGRGHDKVVRYLVSRGANVNAGREHGRSAIVQAICNHHPGLAAWLIAQEADVTVKDVNKDTPLHYAARYGNAAIAELLIGKGADVNAQGAGGRTPLYATICFRGEKDTSVAKVLLEHGADPNICTEEETNFSDEHINKTPLARASYMKEAKMAELLKKFGAKQDE
jgi:ankyrin repeat protein